MAICKTCLEEYPDARKALGYSTCLQCGDVDAQKEIAYRRTCLAPAYNKGPVMYVGSRELAECVGK